MAARMAAVRDSQNSSTEEDRCEECGGSLVEDECNGESILVCESCGFSQPVDSFTADDGTHGPIPSSASSSIISIESKHTAKQKSRYGAKLEHSDAKLIKLKGHIIELAGQLKLGANQIKTAETHARAIAHHRIFTSSYSNRAIAAGLIYQNCYEHTHHNLKKIRAVLPATVTTRVLNVVIRKVKSAQERIQDAPPTHESGHREVIAQGCGLVCEELIMDAVSTIDNAIIKREERDDVVAMATKLWDILKLSNINCKIIVSHRPTIFAVIAVVLTHLRKVTKLKEHDMAMLASHVSLTRSSFQNVIRYVKRAILSLAEMVPSLESVVKNCDKNFFMMIRHIPALLENRSFIVAQTKLRSSLDESSHTLPTDGSAVLMSSCVTRSYDQQDGEDSLSDVDVDQYIASENEVKLKRLLQS